MDIEQQQSLDNLKRMHRVYFAEHMNPTNGELAEEHRLFKLYSDGRTEHEERFGVKLPIDLRS